MEDLHSKETLLAKVFAVVFDNLVENFVPLD